MKLAATLILISLMPTAALASPNQCESDKYHQYVDASLEWYKNLVELTVQKHPDLKEVSDWFMQGRVNHFELNREAFDWYLANDATHLNLDSSVESWLKLSQQDVKTLSQQNTTLGQTAKKAFNDRQTKPHPKNYELRSAFADLLTHPADIKQPLNTYNEKMQRLAAITCK
ncbi:hypothetical protein [Photobacterium leiognathi]|uniref:hypothetical protein n=1 Tax=Photobacterium leiognathi TaxID=553611 RepID=UPI002981AE1D|nr:hypothetical protein [Photobacterium leiognathi]